MAGDEINYPTEHMRTVGKNAHQEWGADTDATHTTLNEAMAAKDSFGNIAALAQYGSVFEQVKNVYVEAIAGAKTDLLAVAEGITNSAKNTQNQDDAAEAALVALWQNWERGPLENESRRDEAAATPEAQAAAAATDEAEAATGVSPESEEPAVDAGPNPDTRADGELPATTGSGPEANPVP
ncbi:hypothetical protein V6K52_07610 [Knoellia sp. S7-12]|uniref:hypothetical protein n=1 Tax=Knoellia sp. S7-12 TaxID=3126698 RepID=UPI00336717D3